MHGHEMDAGSKSSMCVYLSWKFDAISLVRCRLVAWGARLAGVVKHVRVLSASHAAPTALVLDTQQFTGSE